MGKALRVRCWTGSWLALAFVRWDRGLIRAATRVRADDPFAAVSGPWARFVHRSAVLSTPIHRGSA